MTPDVATVMNGIVRSLTMDVAPEVKSEYGTLNMQLMAALLMMVTQEFDRAAARLVDENAALEVLFEDAAKVLGDSDLARQLSAVSVARVKDYTVSGLRARNRELRSLLLRLHESVEGEEGETAHALDERIWAELVESTRRRHLDMAIA